MGGKKKKPRGIIILLAGRNCLFGHFLENIGIDVWEECIAIRNICVDMCHVKPINEIHRLPVYLASPDDADFVGTGRSGDRLRGIYRLFYGAGQLHAFDDTRHVTRYHDMWAAGQRLAAERIERLAPDDYRLSKRHGLETL